MASKATVYQGFNLQQLQVKVLYSSGEDPQFSVKELEFNTPQNKGWCSAKFCEYPQEIILQFKTQGLGMQPFVKLREVQVIVHQTKIPTRIELQAYMPGNYESLQAELPLHKLRFEPLGYLQFEAMNEKAPQRREMKTAFLPEQSKAEAVMLLKLLIHGHHPNRFNIFNQVQIIALNCLGYHYSAPNSSSQHLSQAPIPTAMRFEEELLYDTSTIDKLRHLEEAKREAVSELDFERAKLIKDAMDRLRVVGQSLNGLVARKRQALEQQDFEKAQKLKTEIDSMRLRVVNERHQFEKSDWRSKVDETERMRRALATVRKPEESLTAKGRIALVPLTEELILKPRKEFNMPIDDKERLVPQELLVQKFGSQQSHKEFTPQISRQSIAQMKSHLSQVKQSLNNLDEFLLRNSRDQGLQHQKSQLSNQLNPKNHDELVIPTHQGNKNQQFLDEFGTGQENLDQNLKIPESLQNEDDLKFATPLFAIFNEKLILMLFSADWHTREASLKEIKETLLQGSLESFGSQNPIELFGGIFQISSKTAQDKIAQVALETMCLIVEACSKIYPISQQGIKGNYDFGKNLEKSLQGMMEKIGDNNARLREKTEEAALAMAKQPDIGVQVVAQSLLAKVNQKKPSANSVKHIHGKLVLLKKIIEIFKLKQLSWEETLKFALQYLSHQASEIRNASVAVVLELYLLLKKQIIPELEGLPAKQMELLTKAFSEIDNGNPSGAFSLIGMSYHARPGESQSALLSASNQQQMQKSSQRQSIADGVKRQNTTPACQFCQKKNREFAKEEELDLHLVNECNYLNSCAYCDQVIEIPSLREHYTQDCEKKEELRECPRCHQLVHENVFEKHLEDQTCPANPNSKVLCPLCHKVIEGPDMSQAWHQHLIKDTCRANPRN